MQWFVALTETRRVHLCVIARMSPFTESLCCLVSTKRMSASSFLCACERALVCVRCGIYPLITKGEPQPLGVRWRTGLALSDVSVVQRGEKGLRGVAHRAGLWLLRVCVGHRCATLDAEQTPDLGQRGTRGMGGRTWGMQGNEIQRDRRLDHGNLPRFYGGEVQGHCPASSLRHIT